MRLRSSFWLVLLLTAGCSAPPAPPPPNEIPVANAGPDQSVQLKEQVVVDGSASSDPEETPLRFFWEASLDNPAQIPVPQSQVQFSFVPGQPGTYWFILSVSDGEFTSRPDSIRIVVLGSGNQPPVAEVVSEFSIYPFGTPVILDAINSSDPDGDTLTYIWRLVGSPFESQATIADTTARQTSAAVDIPGDYRFVLKVFDGQLPDSTTFIVRVEAPDNLPPQPEIEAETQAALGTLVTLDGSASSDADDDPLAYHWVVQAPSGLTVVLPDSTAPQTAFTPAEIGAYTVLLEVDDGQATSRAKLEILVSQAIFNELEGMIEIPEGPFVMGSDQGASDESPPHRVELSTFWFDKFEVTAAAYQECVDTGGCTQSNGGSGCNTGNPGRADHPINCVTWEQAQSYCIREDKRLPTEAEWEKAARGLDGRRFVWGEEFPSRDRMNYGDQIGSTTPIGTYPTGVSYYGAHNMGGNVHEWTADFFDGNYYASSPERDPPGPATGALRVVRGASWSVGVPLEVLTATVRQAFQPTTSDKSLGFRCARTQPPGQ